jgi:signal peptidase I
VTVLLFLLVSYILLSISLFFIFPKAGEEGWKGLIPGLNFVVWCKIIGRPGWWAALLLIPIVNFFIYWGMAVDMVRSFKRYSLLDSILAVVYAPIPYFQIGLQSKYQYDGPNVIKERAYKEEMEQAKKAGQKAKYEKLARKNPYHKSSGREWIESIAFAVFAAAFIRMFLIEAYTIPTPSMEGSLLAGDYLFVSKVHYGMRTPITVLQLPLLHNRIPIIGGESYWKNPSLPYYRLPRLEKIDHNEPVVFNWPAGDEVILTPQRSFSKDQLVQNGREDMLKQYKLIERPMDKTDFYIKRCVGLPGDTLEILERQIYINGKKLPQPQKVQFRYKVQSKGSINSKAIEDLDISPTAYEANNIINLNQDQIDGLKAIDPTITVSHVSPPVYNKLTLFPHDPQNFPGWTWDNYGPIYIPAKGQTVKISPANIALYKRIIDVYENHELKIEDDKIYIDGEVADRYTFEYDYYWMMGDNRHQSEDSRAWGFVPETHIVGKPLLVVFSSKFGSIGNGLRWDRFLKSVGKMN